MQVAFMWDKLGSKEVAMEDIPDWRVRTLRNMTINTAHYAQGVSRWPKEEVKLIYTENLWGYFKLKNLHSV